MNKNTNVKRDLFYDSMIIEFKTEQDYLVWLKQKKIHFKSLGSLKLWG